MKVHGLADVERGEDCEDVSLDRRDQQLDHAHEHDESHRQQPDADAASAMAVQRLHDEVAEDVQEHVTGKHGDEGPQAEAEGPDEEADELDGRNHELEDERRVFWHEQRENMETMLPEADAE